MTYSLLDSGQQYKLERFAEYIIARPCAQAVWQPQLSRTCWESANARFTRDQGNQWVLRGRLPEAWQVVLHDLCFKVMRTNFGHLGLFPEHAMQWAFIEEQIKKRSSPNILNLFAYSGGATLAAARAGARVCHLDASKTSVAWARENAALNQLTDRPIRWIVEDVLKFLGREINRKNRYDGIILDPPTFGRGSQKEIFKIEEHLQFILSSCRQLLSDRPLFVVFTSHTPGFTPIVMQHLLEQMMAGLPGRVEIGEMVLQGSGAFSVPSGSFARWCHAS